MHSYSRRVVFIGGIHGVGKSTICKNISGRVGFEYLSASQLIKWSEISPQQNKLVKDINGTQDRLITALQKHVNSSSYYILDGHYCLLNSEGMVTTVPLEIFKKISPLGLGIVIDDLYKVKSRLEERDKRYYEINQLERMQKKEIAYADYISQQLQIKLYTISQGEFEDIIEPLIRLKSNESFTRH